MLADAAQLIAIAALVMACVALGLAATALQKAKAIRGAYRDFSHGGSDDVFTAMSRHTQAIEEMRAEVHRQTEVGNELREGLEDAVRHVSTVRYDAFDDIGGQQSFSTAWLDGHGDGVVVTCINGRNEARTYAKAITSGHAKTNLSDEELLAIEQAMGNMGKIGKMGPRA